MRIFTMFALLLFVQATRGEPVLLPSGMSVTLELQHHVNSHYTPTGSPIYFRVLRDVHIGDHTLIAEGTTVQGRMVQSAKRGMVGKSGLLSLEVDAIQAVDGTVIPVDAEVEKSGRSRAGATVAWTLFWGLPGLVTRGVNPYLEKGTELLATTRADARVDPALAIAPAAKADPGLAVAIVEHRWENDRANT